jgi:putative peptide zinc metalloprotease protein
LTVDVAADPVLPRLRQELRIDRGAPLVTGAPSWTLTDPVRYLFFQLGTLEMRIFSLWSTGTLNTVRAGLAADGLDPEESEAAIGTVLQFSLANSLTVRPDGDPVAAFSVQRAQARKAWWKWLVDHYLFIRLPLVKPALFLEKTLPRIAFLWSPQVIAAFGALALLGLFLVARQWDSFLASFPYFFSMDGIIAYGIALSCVKVIHELGHAFTATKYGVRVPTMGISLLIMMPVLYTDTTGAWRLTSRRKRLMIDIAGVTAEMMVASVATMAWVMLPDGSVRSAAFVLATSSWAMSLMINLNPLMRYDGYYIFSDALSVPNLQIRAFVLGRWWLREMLFGLGEPRPEDMPCTKERILIAYALTTWVYRFFLFLGIAIVVYHMFFKLLGIILFVVEISVFLARPILKELGEWAKRKDQIMATPRGRWLGWGMVAVALVIILPLDRHVTAPAVLSTVTAAPLVAGDPARIDRVLVRDGQTVAKGAVLAELSAPDLARDAQTRSINIARLELQLSRAASDQIDLANRAVLEQELATERAALSGLSLREAKLVLRAPAAGIVTDLTPEMHGGRWVGGSEIIARIVSPGAYDVQAFISEGDTQRIAQGALARFIPDDPTQKSRRAKLVERATSAALTLDQPILASTNGGPIAADKEGTTLKPRKPVFRARLITERSNPADEALIQIVPGQVRIDAESRSILGTLTRWIMQILRGEASLS